MKKTIEVSAFFAFLSAIYIFGATSALGDAIRLTETDGVGGQTEEFVVTGARASLKAGESPVPIQVSSGASPKTTGKLKIHDTLLEFVPSDYNLAGSVGQTGEAVKSAGLHGLQ